LLRFLPASATWAKYGGEKPFSWGKPAYVDLFSSDLDVQGHIGRTSGDDLSPQNLRDHPGPRLSPGESTKWILTITYFVSIVDLAWFSIMNCLRLSGFSCHIIFFFCCLFTCNRKIGKMIIRFGSSFQPYLLF
jgi:hypothetical protein